MTLINKILLGAGAAIVCLILAVFLWLSLANAHLKTQLAQAQARDTVCRLANADFAQDVARSNQAAEALRAQSAAQEKRAQEVSRTAEQQVERYRRVAEHLRQARVHGDVCARVEKLFTLYQGERP